MSQSTNKPLENANKFSDLVFNEETGGFEYGNSQEDNTINEENSSTTKEANEPSKIYNETTAEFEYEDPELAKIQHERYIKKSTNIDHLAYRQEKIKKRLKEAGLDGKMGKTASTDTGKVSEEHKKVAEISSLIKSQLMRKRYNNK